MFLFSFFSPQTHPDLENGEFTFNLECVSNEIQPCFNLVHLDNIYLQNLTSHHSILKSDSKTLNDGNMQN